MPAHSEHDAQLSTDTWESLFRTQVSVMRQLQSDPDFKQLTMREYDVMFNLTRCPTGWTRLKDLNEHLLLSQPSLSRMLDRLEARGLVMRRAAASDHRGVELALTDAGLALQRSMGRIHVKRIRSLLEPALTQDELRDLRRLTDKLRRSVDGV